MKEVEIFTGIRFYYLTALSEPFRKATKDKTRTRKVISVECDCGTIKDVNFSDLKATKIKSCGCMMIDLVRQSTTTHGMTYEALYGVWASMKKRCDNPNFFAYHDYGGRGINYQKSWATFQDFCNDMSEGYSEYLELDRIDVNGNYCKENCRWVARGVNCHNRRKRKGSRCLSIGVCMKESKFRAQLTFEGSTVFRQIFLTEQEAAKAYDDVSEQYYGDRPNKTIKELLVPI